VRNPGLVDDPPDSRQVGHQLLGALLLKIVGHLATQNQGVQLQIALQAPQCGVGTAGQPRLHRGQPWLRGTIFGPTHRDHGILTDSLLFRTTSSGGWPTPTHSSPAPRHSSLPTESRLRLRNPGRLSSNGLRPSRPGSAGKSAVHLSRILPRGFSNVVGRKRNSASGVNLSPFDQPVMTDPDRLSHPEYSRPS